MDKNSSEAVDGKMYSAKNSSKDSDDGYSYYYYSSKDYWYKKGTKFSETYHVLSKNATQGFDSKMFAK